MSNTLNLGDGKWAAKEGSLLAYNSENGNYKPLPFNFERASSATVVNKDGLIETVGNDIPRIDYSDDAKGALLLEPQRTNSLVQSNQFDTTWSNLALTPLSSQIGVGGSTDAWLLNVTGNSGSVRQNVSQNGVQTLSVYAKKSVSNWIALYVASTVDPPYVFFDLDNGVVGTSSGDNTINENIESVGNGWYRCSITFDRTISSNTIRIFPSKSNGVLGSNGDSVYIQNAQLEPSYATSYIPTQGSAVTRVQDVCNNGANEQVINSTEGVLYYEVSAQDNSITTSILSISSGSNANSLYSGFSSSSNTIQAQLVVGGVAQTNMNYVVSDRTKFNKVAILYQNNNHKMYVNGVEAVVDTSGSVPSANTFDRLNFDLGQGSFDFYGNVKDVRVYNTALTDAELQALTTL